MPRSKDGVTRSTDDHDDGDPDPRHVLTHDYGRYEPLFPIAQGGMAEVFAARLRGEGLFERYFAIKRMREELSAEDRFVRLFLDEARLSAQIESPHVVPVIDVGRDEVGAPFLVMDLVLGVSLKRLVDATGTPPPAIAVEVGRQAALGLDAAHHATDAFGEPLGIVHRDISPQNILVGIDGRARIADFGVARAKRRLAQGTRTGELKGKYGYVAPEQLTGHADARTDVFALGVVMWEVLAGRPLFTARRVIDTLANVRNMPIPPVHELRAGVPPELSDVLQRALERDPGRRYQSARELATALQALAFHVMPIPDPSDLRRLARRASSPLLDAVKGAAQRMPEIRSLESAATEVGRPGASQTRRKLIVEPVFARSSPTPTEEGGGDDGSLDVTPVQTARRSASPSALPRTPVSRPAPSCPADADRRPHASAGDTPTEIGPRRERSRPVRVRQPAPQPGPPSVMRPSIAPLRDLGAEPTLVVPGQARAAPQGRPPFPHAAPNRQSQPQPERAPVVAHARSQAHVATLRVPVQPAGPPPRMHAFPPAPSSVATMIVPVVSAPAALRAAPAPERAAPFAPPPSRACPRRAWADIQSSRPAQLGLALIALAAALVVTGAMLPDEPPPVSFRVVPVGAPAMVTHLSGDPSAIAHRLVEPPMAVPASSSPLAPPPMVTPATDEPPARAGRSATADPRAAVFSPAASSSSLSARARRSPAPRTPEPPEAPTTVEPATPTTSTPHTPERVPSSPRFRGLDAFDRAGS